jgi:hypothetical protein
MRLRRDVAAAALIGVSSFAMPAEAQYVSWRTSLTGSGNYSYSLTDAPYPDAQTFAGPSVSLSPSLILLFDTPLTTNTLTYAFSLTLPFDKDLKLATGPLSYSNRLSYSGRYQLSEVSNVSLSLSGSHSPTRTTGFGGDASETQIDPVPAGASYLLSVSATESFTRQFDGGMSALQSTGLNLNAPFDPLVNQARTIGISNSLTFSRAFESHTLGVVASVAVSYFTLSETAGGGVVDPHTGITDSLSLTWSHPLTPTLTTSAMLGVTQIINPGTETPTAVSPSGNASLTYNLDFATMTLTLAHGAAPNLVTGSVNFTDSGTLRFNLPIGQTGLSTSGTGGFTHMTPLGSLSSPTNIFLGDLSLSYHAAALPSLTLSGRASLQRQLAGDSSGFTRLTTSLSLAYSYPSATTAQVQANLPPALGATPYVPGASAPPEDRPFDVPPEEPQPEPTPPP